MKEKFKNIKKGNRGIRKNANGITLIALIVTIIVLIILAGVTINLLMGDNGILTRAKGAKEINEQETVREEIIMLLAEYQMSQVTDNKDFTTFMTEKGVSLIEETDSSYVVEYKDYRITINKKALEIEDIEKNIGLSLRTKTLKLEKDEQAQIQAELIGGATGTITYTSNDTSVATVDSTGKVTAVGNSRRNYNNSSSRRI